MEELTMSGGDLPSHSTQIRHCRGWSTFNCARRTRPTRGKESLRRLSRRGKSEARRRDSTPRSEIHGRRRRRPREGRRQGAPHPRRRDGPGVPPPQGWRTPGRDLLSTACLPPHAHRHRGFGPSSPPLAVGPRPLFSV